MLRLCRVFRTNFLFIQTDTIPSNDIEFSGSLDQGCVVLNTVSWMNEGITLSFVTIETLGLRFG